MAPAVTAENRKEKRKGLGHPARIFVWEAPAIDCNVEDVSNGGAMLFVEDQSKVPTTFLLIFASGGFRRKCEVVWRSWTHIGVKFAQSDSEEP